MKSYTLAKETARIKTPKHWIQDLGLFWTRMPFEEKVAEVGSQSMVK